MSDANTSAGTDLPSARISLTLPAHFSWVAVAKVIAEKFGWRGLRIAFMIAAPVVYFAYKGCTSVLCSIMYVGAAATVILFVIVVWTAQESLDNFARQHASGAWLTLDAVGIGGESGNARFSIPWTDFKRVVERGSYWLLETKAGAWMVIPTTGFSREAWQVMRAQRKELVRAR